MNVCFGTGKIGEATRHEEVVVSGIDCPACREIEARLKAEEALAEANHLLLRSDLTIHERDMEIAALKERELQDYGYIADVIGEWNRATGMALPAQSEKQHVKNA